MSCIVTVPPPSSAPVPRLRPQRSRSWRSCSTSRNNPDHSSVIIKAPHLLMRGFLMGGGSEPADRKRTLPSTFIIPSPASHPESAQIQRRISNNDRIHAVTVPFPQTLQIMFVGPYFPLDRQRISSPPRLSKTADFIPQTPIRQKPRLPRPSFSSPSPEDFRNIR